MQRRGSKFEFIIYIENLPYICKFCYDATIGVGAGDGRTVGETVVVTEIDVVVGVVTDEFVVIDLLLLVLLDNADNGLIADNADVVESEDNVYIGFNGLICILLFMLFVFIFMSFGIIVLVVVPIFVVALVVALVVAVVVAVVVAPVAILLLLVIATNCDIPVTGVTIPLLLLITVGVIPGILYNDGTIVLDIGYILLFCYLITCYDDIVRIKSTIL